MVIYTKTTTENMYNLGFGDYDESTNEINVAQRAKRRVEKVFRTVLNSILEFNYFWQKEF